MTTSIDHLPTTQMPQTEPLGAIEKYVPPMSKEDEALVLIGNQYDASKVTETEVLEHGDETDNALRRAKAKLDALRKELEPLLQELQESLEALRERQKDYDVTMHEIDAKKEDILEFSERINRKLLELHVLKTWYESLGPVMNESIVQGRPQDILPLSTDSTDYLLLAGNNSVVARQLAELAATLDPIYGYHDSAYERNDRVRITRMQNSFQRTGKSIIEVSDQIEKMQSHIETELRPELRRLINELNTRAIKIQEQEVVCNQKIKQIPIDEIDALYADSRQRNAYQEARALMEGFDT